MNLFSSPSPDYRLFISHAWDYKAEYDGVVNLLNADWTFKWVNLSVPVDDPLPSSVIFPMLGCSVISGLVRFSLPRPAARATRVALW